MYKSHGTVKDRLIFSGPDFISRNDVNVEVTPRDDPGIIFESPLGKIMVSKRTLRPFRGKIGGERYLVLSTNHQESRKSDIKLRVVEHFLSAMYCAGITSANVKVDQIGMPSISPGISGVFETLNVNRADLGLPLPVFAVDRPMIYNLESSIKKGETSYMKVKPSSTLDVRIKASKYFDLFDLGSETLEVTDVYSHIDENTDARPLGRLAFKPVYGIWKILNKINIFRGVNDSTYVIVGPNDNKVSVQNKMHEKYSRGRNEYMAHTIFADFFGELHTFFPGIVQGEFEFFNANHFTRIEAMEKLYKSGNFQRIS